MDSKLVVEQMSGNWKIKHPSMKPLALEAKRLAPAGRRTPGCRAARTCTPTGWPTRRSTGCGRDRRSKEQPWSRRPRQCRHAGRQRRNAAGVLRDGKPTTLVLVRHGVTDATKGKLFSGGLASSNPPLNDEGREQARATGEWLAPLSGTFDALVSSPVRRTRETAEILAEFFDLEVEEEHAIAEMEFGTWDGMSFTEVHEKFPDEISSWLGDLESAPHGGESFRAVEKRVLEGRDRMLTTYAGRTVVVVSHVTPIKTLVAEALGAPLEAVYRMELAPASVTVISYFKGGPDARHPDGQPAPLQRPPDRDLRHRSPLPGRPRTACPGRRRPASPRPGAGPRRARGSGRR